MQTLEQSKGVWGEQTINGFPRKTTSNGGRHQQKKPKRKLRGRPIEIKEAEKGKSFSKEWLVNRVKGCINVKLGDKKKWGY